MIEHIKKSLQTKLKVVLLLLVTLILYNGWEPRLGIFPPTSMILLLIIMDLWIF